MEGSFLKEVMDRKVRLIYEVAGKREELVGEIIAVDEEFIRFIAETGGLDTEPEQRDMLISKTALREIWNLP